MTTFMASMMKKVLAVVCAGGTITPVSAGELRLPARERFKVFLLIGQSNMAGRGAVEDSDRQPHPRVLMFDKHDRWAPATEPLHFDKPGRAGVGPGLSFGRAVAEALPGDTIGLVPAAVGGTSIEKWAKDGPLYAEAVRRARLAMQSGQLAGILWHQGESGGPPETYAAQAQKLFADLRAELDAPQAPVVVGTLGDFAGMARRLNPVLWSLPGQIPRCGCADASGLTHKGDRLHFDAASARELGRRYAREWLRLSGIAAPARAPSGAAEPSPAGQPSDRLP
jgi:hypothetical protein